MYYVINMLLSTVQLLETNKNIIFVRALDIVTCKSFIDKQIHELTAHLSVV